MKKLFLRISIKFTGKHLCQSLFFNKVAGLWLQRYCKEDSDTGVLVNFAKFLKMALFILWWLFLLMTSIFKKIILFFTPTLLFSSYWCTLFFWKFVFMSEFELKWLHSLYTRTRLCLKHSILGSQTCFSFKIVLFLIKKRRQFDCWKQLPREKLVNW